MMYSENGIVLVDTGTRAKPQDNPHILLEVEHDETEYQIPIYYIMNNERTVEDLKVQFDEAICAEDFQEAQEIIDEIARYDVQAADVCAKELKDAKRID